MHELAVTESILEIALRHASRAGASKIVRLNLVIGQLSSIVDDSVQFYWDIIAKDTSAEGALLNFERIPAELSCRDCHHRYQPGAGDLACPACQSTKIQVVAGREFFIESMDVE
jgi:hydrogenase nickel incorporation protein HypA/HybF